jgi:quinol monooxygenase YgiN
MEVWVTARFMVKEGMAEEMLEHLRVLVTDVRQEPGCLFDDCIQDASNPLAFTFIEHWQTQADFDAHVVSAASRKWAADTGHMIAKPCDIQMFKSIWRQNPLNQ